ncbi:DUF4397 domain-containing protein [Pedobacter frigoris]|uniref:DUF4397 domain-containing protein n=1 Tax=Pedobacter frigoris TaxID=2571272 RepID=A0A4U1CFI4_9SPHI|nr:DUF4397 domain-containing protein [Pedobacter frigoris]TKC05912.1 DUF4397 domain-containing protein [Pedobacter frigoris]
MTNSPAKPLLKSLLAIAIILGMLMVVLIFDSCKKDPVTTVNTSYLSVTNTSPTLSTFNFYLNQSKANTGALPFGGTIPYLQVNPGEYNAKLTTESNTESLLTKKIVLEKDKIYSLFVIDKADKLDYLQITDDIKVPGTDKALIRFINLSPDASALNLSVKDGAAIATDKAYKSAGTFLEVDAKLYTFEIKDKATSAVKAELKDIDLKKGGIYTVIARGLLNATDTERAFSGQVITNK